MKYTIEHIQTPNGSDVQVLKFLDDVSNEYKEYLEEKNYNDYGMYSDSEATHHYNCHSYAWHEQYYYNNYWMDLPNIYYNNTDSSYIEVTSEIRPGDIICYYNYYGRNIHSGVVTDVSTSLSTYELDDLDTIEVQSKWGPSGLYTHQGDNCPYTTQNPYYSLIPSEKRKEIFAYSIKFCRPRTDSTHQLAEDIPVITLSETLAHTGEITDRYVMYEFDVEDKIPYLITVTSNISTNDRFYDSSMNYQNVSGFDMGNGKWGYIYTFDVGINYFRIQNVSETTDANIVINVYPHNGHRQINAVYEDEDYHSYTCECGTVTHELHRWRDYSFTHVVCVDCGLLKRLPPEGFTPIIKGITPDTETE